MAPLLYNTAFVEHDDAPCIADGREAVRDDDESFVFDRAVKLVKYFCSIILVIWFMEIFNTSLISESVLIV